MIVSSSGNDDVKEENANLISQDNIGEVRLIMYRFKPVRDENKVLIAMDCSLAYLVNPGKIPWFAVSRVLSAHANMLEN